MFNLETKLEQLIQPVASCDYRADLSIWISGIVASAQDSMVLVDENKRPRGLVTKIDLLSFISTSLPIQQEQSLNLDNQASLDDLIQPLPCLPATNTVKQFLDNLDQKLGKNNYAVIDRQGKLLGLVNISELLTNFNPLPNKPTHQSHHQFSDVITNLLARNNWQPLPNKQSNDLRHHKISSKQTNYSNANHQNNNDKQEISALLYSLLNRSLLPIQIKNNNGDICYTNPAWQQEIETKSPFPSPSNHKSINSWLTFNEKNLTHPRTSSSLTNQIAQYQCSQLNNFLLSPFSNNPHGQNQSHFTNWSQLSLGDTSQDDQSKSVEQKQKKQPLQPEWIYHELPFSIKQNSLSLNEQPQYNLVIATKTNFIDTSNNSHFSQIQNNLQQLQHHFFVSISHDLKSPLTSIVGLSRLLNEEKLGTLNDNQMRYSKMIYHSGKKLITLVNEFLNINRLTNQKLSINAEEIVLEDLINDTYHQISDKLKAIAEPGSKQHQVDDCLDLSVSNKAKTIIADRICLHQILTRLLENSFTSFPPSQRIKITAQYWSQKWLAINIWGQGKITSSTQKAFFAQELQSDHNNLLTSEENKQFLGLCLAQQLAKFHGGDISLIAKHNHTHQFTVLLPQVNSIDHQNKNLDLQDHNLAQQGHENYLVLVLDNDLERILSWQQEFENLGYYLLVARSSEDLIYKANCFQPHSIIIDSSFIDKKTENLLEELNSSPANQDINLIYVDRNSENLQSLDRDFLNKIKQQFERILPSPINTPKLKQIFPPVKKEISTPKKSLTVMRLSVSDENHRLENCILDSVFENPSFCLCHHIIEADSLEQAYLLARIWKIDAIIWDGQIEENHQHHLESLAKIDLLANIPIITLDKRNTAIANQIANLAVFPCLLPAHERSIEKLTQVIQIAAEVN